MKDAIWIILTIVFVIIIIGGAVTIIYIANQNGLITKGNSGDDANSSMEIFIKAVKDNGEPAQANYIIWQDNKSVVQGETTFDAYIPLKIENNSDIKIYCWGEKYYLTETKKTFKEQELKQQRAKIDCNLRREGNVELDLVKGNLNNEEGDIILNITPRNGILRDFGVCTSWTAGFLRVELKDTHRIICDKGVWKNYTDYNPETRQWIWTPEGEYICGESEVKECSEVEGNKCKPIEMDIPRRLLSKVNECSLYGVTIAEDQSERVVLNYQSREIKNQLDSIEIYIVDFDKRFNAQSNRFLEFPEYLGEDLGMEDIIYELNYGGENVRIQ